MIWEDLYNRIKDYGSKGMAIAALSGIDIALWDLVGKTCGQPIHKLIGGAFRTEVTAYATGLYFIDMDRLIEEAVEEARGYVEEGFTAVKMKIGLGSPKLDLERVAAVREAVGGGTRLMVDANQQWDRVSALRIGRQLESFELTWIEEPLDAYDAEGHAMLADKLDTPIATGEMLTSTAEHRALIERRAVDFIQPDAARVGGITQFLRIMALGEEAGLKLAPHFAMEIHLHLSAAYALDAWVEHFEWLEPLFNERLRMADGRMHVPARPGLGFSFSDQARALTVETITVNAP